VAAPLPEVRCSGNAPGRYRRQLGLSALASIVISVALLYHHVLPLGAVVKGDVGGDYGLMAWNLWVVTEAVLHGENPYHTNLVFYPLGSHLAKHTLAPGFFPLTLASKWFWNRPTYPLYAYRAAILVSFSLATVLAWTVFKELGASALGGLAAGVAYSFSSFYKMHIPHLNVVSGAFLIPACTLALVRFLKSPSRLRAALAAAVWGCGIYFSEFILLLFLALAVCMAVAACSRQTREIVLRSLRTLGASGIGLGAAILFGCLAPFFANWLRDDGNYPLPRQSYNWNANLAGFVVPDPLVTPLYAGSGGFNSELTKGIGGREVFLGFPLILFAALGACVAPPFLRRLSLLVAGVFLVLALGPTLKIMDKNTWIPLPYLLLMKIPPFNLSRTPVRYVAIGLFSLSILYALGVTHLSRSLSRFGSWPGRGLTILALVWSAAEAYRPGPETEPFEVPRELAQLAPGPVVNLPLYFMDGHAVLLQTLHGRPILTGFVSRRSARQVDHVRRLQHLLDSDLAGFVKEMESLGVRNVIVGFGTTPSQVKALRGTGLRVIDLRRLR